MEQILWPLVLQIVLIMLNAVFACAEIAVISVNEAKIALLAEKGDKRAVRLGKLVNEPARFLATIQVAITLSGFLGSAFAADNFSDPLTDWLIKLGVPFSAKTIDTAAVIVITLALSYFTLIFGELVPKRIAMKKAEQLALLMSSAVFIISKFFAPLVALLTASTNFVLRLCGINPDEADPGVSEEEICLMVDEGSRRGIIDIHEQKMIHNIFEFDDLAVHEFATHRQDVALLMLDDTIENWHETILKTGHRYYPICDKTADRVKGVLHSDLYFRCEVKTKEIILAQAMRPAWFVPETIKADVLFKKMKETRRHFAVALDEYGGMTSIVTIRDLVEQLVGDFTENGTDDTASVSDIEQTADGSWLLTGSASLDNAAEKLGVELPVAEFDTFGGYVFGLYGTIPDDGSVFTVETADLRISVTLIRDRRIVHASVTRLVSGS